MALPYFPMFPSDFEAKTSHLTLAEDGAYNRLLRICWMNPGCTISNDDAWIMRRVRAHTDQDKDAVRSILAEFFTIENNRYSNAKLMQIWHDTNEAHEKRKNAGSRGGKAKSLKNNKTVSSNAVAKPKQPEPEPNKEKDISNDISKNSPKKKYGTPRQELEKVLSADMAEYVIEHRQRIRRPLTGYAAKLLAGELSKAINPNAAADVMINRGWTGFKVEWLNNSQTNQPKRTLAQVAMDEVRAENERNKNEQEHTDSGANFLISYAKQS